MNTRSLWTCAVAAVFLAALASTAGLAATPAARPADASELQTLKQAYAMLSQADHDYKGHRVRAMRAIEGACKLLGGGVQGDGAGHEAQASSDAQLRQAQSLLQGVRGSAAAANQVRVVHHIDRAISELNTALSVR